MTDKYTFYIGEELVKNEGESLGYDLTDDEMESILAAAFDAGARRAGFVSLRLPLEISDLFEEWLKAHPDAWTSWLDGVTTIEGKPGLDAARKSLGL